jgi:azurin
MKFNLKEIKLKAGVESTIRLVNKASAAGMDHNLVITKKGQFNAVALAAVSAGAEKDWVPESPEVVGHSKLAKPGETVEFKVTLEKGEYEFVCTFPGHYLTMNGKVVVE